VDKKLHTGSLWCRHTVSLLALSMLLVSACATVPPPARVRPAKPFQPSPAPGLLTVKCSSLKVGGCDALGAVQSEAAAFQSLHTTQMNMLEGLLQDISRMLSRSEIVPRANISAYSPNTDAWNDPNGIYPAKLAARFDYDRGLNRLNDISGLDLKQSLKTLREAAKAADKHWQELVNDSRTQVPAAITDARTMAQVSIQFVDQAYTFSVPEPLAERYLKRDARPWDALVSHVITEDKLKHKRVQEHRLHLVPALTVVHQDSLSGLTINIVESPALRHRKDFHSQVHVGDFCKKLRGELRFVARDQRPPMKAIFRSTTKKEGAK
jgi:hypothetical protein